MIAIVKADLNMQFDTKPRENLLLILDCIYTVYHDYFYKMSMKKEVGSTSHISKLIRNVNMVLLENNTSLSSTILFLRKNINYWE